MKTSKQLAIMLVATCTFTLGPPWGTIQAKGGKKKTTSPYILVDLMGLPGYAYQSEGKCLTNRGGDGGVLVVGNSHLYIDPDSVPPRLPVLWNVDSQGNIGPDDPLHLGLPPFAAEVEAKGINFHGTIVGVTQKAILREEDKWIFPAYVYTPSRGYQELPIPAGASRSTDVRAINDSGQVLGWYKIPDASDPDQFTWYTAIWQIAANRTIGDPLVIHDSTEGHVSLRDINNYGIMTGTVVYGESALSAIAWLEGSTLTFMTVDLPTGVSSTNARALNNCPTGDPGLTVVGYAMVDDDGSTQQRAFAWRPFAPDNEITIYGTLGGASSSACDVNTAGDIVGWSTTKRGFPRDRAAIFVDGEAKDLNSMVDTDGTTLTFCNAINDDGDITGTVKLPRPVSELHGFLLQRIQE